MRKFKGLLVFLLGLLLLTACGKDKVTLEVNTSLTLQVGQEVKLTVNQVAKDLEFSGMGEVLEIRTSGDDVYVKALKVGNVDLKVTYKPNKKINATIKVTVNPKPVEQGYTLNFSVTVPADFTGDVYVLGGFNSWTLADALKLTKGADGKYTGTATFDTDEASLEYKYFNHNEWEYGEGSETGGYRGNREVSLTETTINLEDEILSWEKVYDGTPLEPEKEYTFTFNVTVPEGTEGNVYVVGNFTNWLDDPCTPLQLTEGDDNTYTGTITYTTNKSLLYKYVNAKDLASINWDYEEEVSGNRELTIEALTANDTVTAWKKGGYKEGAVEAEYTLNFKVTVPFLLPEGYKVWVVGFNGWDKDDALELVPDGLDYFGEATITTEASQIEYMVVAGLEFGWDHKPLKEDGTEYGFGENINHVLVDGVNEINYVVHAWKDLSEGQEEPQEYTFTFNVTVPEGTEGNVFVVGNFTNWLDDPCTPLQLTKGEGNLYSGEVTYKTNIALSYKYLNAKDLESLNYDYEEVVQGNRSLAIADLVANDTVEAWKSGGYKEAAVEVEYTLNFSITVPFQLPEGYKVFVIGSFNSWKEETAVELTGTELVHTGTTTVTTSATQIEYMVVAGQTFGWAHKPLKDDNTEYGFGENITHTLVEGANTVEYTVHAWKDLTEAPVEETYTLTFNVTVPEGTEGEVFVVGSFTNWLDEPSTPLKLTKNTDGTYSGTVEYTTVASTVEYKYLNAKDLASLNYDYEELVSANRVLTLTTPTATDTVETWKAGGYKAEVVPEMVDVVVRLTSIPTTTETFPIKLIGSMVDWKVADALTFELVGEVYEATLTVDKNKTNEFKLYLDKGQTNWWDHQASPDGTAEYGNRVITADEYTALLIEIEVPQWKGLTPTDPESEIVYVVIRLTSVPETTGEFPIKLIGSMTGWSAIISETFEKVSGVYEVTLDVEKNVENKFCLYLDKGQAEWHEHQAADEFGIALADHIITEEEYAALLVEIAVPNWKGLTPPAPVEMVDVVVRLTSIPTTTETFPIKLIGNMTDWNPLNSLVFEPVLEVYEITLNVDKNVENKFCLYLDKEQAEWHAHQAADENGVALADHVITAAEYTALLVEIAVPNWKGITPPAPEETYTLTFNVTVPEGTEGEVFVVGTFTNWLDEPATPLKLTKNTDGTYSGTVEYTTVASTVEYKYLNAKDLATLNYDYEELISANRVLTLATPTATDTVEAWKAGGYKAEAPELTYTLNFTVGAPADFTGDVYVLGEFNNWNLETALKLTKGETNYTGTTTYTTNKTTMEYKYFNHPAWDYAEGNEANAHIGNRSVELVETLALTDTILGWEKVYVEPAPGVEYTLNFSFNINVYIPEGYKVFLIGDFNNWDVTTPVELVGEAGLYTYQTTYTTDKTKLDYMIVTGETFGWAHKTLKPDNSEYVGEENIVHDLVAGENAISYIVPGWAGITPPTPPAEYTLTFTVTVPEGTEGNVYVAGSFTNWTNPESTPLLLTKGEGNTYTGTTTITTQETSIEYKYVNSNDLVTNYYEVRDLNRVLELATPTATDTVSAWIDGGYHAPAPEVTYTINFTVEVPADFTGDVYVAGSFTNWLEEGSTPLKLTKNADGKYVGSTTYTTTDTTIQYKYFNHTEYTYVEGTLDGGVIANREVTLTETTNIVDVVAGWEAVYVEPTP